MLVGKLSPVVTVCTSRFESLTVGVDVANVILITPAIFAIPIRIRNTRTEIEVISNVECALRRTLLGSIVQHGIKDFYNMQL
jgi:hypothetical protein